MESVACPVPMRIINTTCDAANGKSGTRQVSTRMLPPRPRASCLPGGNEVGYPADNDEPRCQICRHGTRPREPTEPPPKGATTGGWRKGYRWNRHPILCSGDVRTYARYAMLDHRPKVWIRCSGTPAAAVAASMRKL